MDKNVDVTIRQAANGFIVEARSEAVNSSRLAAGHMVFDSAERLKDWLWMHFALSDPQAQAVGVPQKQAEVMPARWGRE
jgi:hypothetical protein